MNRGGWNLQSALQAEQFWAEQVWDATKGLNDAFRVATSTPGITIPAWRDLPMEHQVAFYRLMQPMREAIMKRLLEYGQKVQP